jgi:rod shape-determining protein MreD
MTRKTVLGVLVPALVVLHFLLHVGFSLQATAPDLLTLALLLAVRETGMGSGGILGFFLGLCEDAFSLLAFGASTLAMTVIGVLGARTRDLFVGDSRLFFFVYLTLGKLLKETIYWVGAGQAARGPFLDTVFVLGGLGALYVAVVGLGLVSLFGGFRSLS